MHSPAIDRVIEFFQTWGLSDSPMVDELQNTLKKSSVLKNDHLKLTIEHLSICQIERDKSNILLVRRTSRENVHL